MLRFFTEKQIRDRIQTAVDAAVASAVAPLLARIAEWEQQIAGLEKNSSNSSKPPSSDIVKPSKITVSQKKGRRRKGAQPGHPRHERTPFTEEESDRQVTYEREDLDPKEWKPLDEWDVVQQIELKESPVEIIEYRARHYRHRRTERVVCAALPEEVKAAGLVGPRLSAYVGATGHSNPFLVLRDQALLSTFLSTGARVSELINANLGDLSRVSQFPS